MKEMFGEHLEGCLERWHSPSPAPVCSFTDIMTLQKPHNPTELLPTQFAQIELLRLISSMICCYVQEACRSRQDWRRIKCSPSNHTNIPLVGFVWSFAGRAPGLCCAAIPVAVPLDGAVPAGGRLLFAAEALVAILLAIIAAEREYPVFVYPGPGRFAIDVDRSILDDPIRVTFP